MSEALSPEVLAERERALAIFDRAILEADCAAEDHKQSGEVQRRAALFAGWLRELRAEVAEGGPPRPRGLRVYRGG